MRITNLTQIISKYYIEVSAEVAFNGQKPERMYFETDLKHKKFIPSDYSPFLAAVLLPSMKTGEDIEIDGPVSKKQLQNTKKIMNLVESWDIGLQKIKIRTKGYSDDKSSSQKRIGVFFSAGVDSFYTYLKHKKQITDLIFVHGFDIPLGNTSLFHKVKKINENIAKVENKNLITVRTNIADIVEKKLLWDFAHGGALAAVGLFLGLRLKKVFISAAVKKDNLFPYGTHPDLDPLWSTENTNFVHEGTECARLEKIMKIGKSELVLKYLHVCAQNIKGKYNCSKCYKCLTTMIGLICAGTLDRSKTFDKKIDLSAVRNMYYDYSLLYNIQGEANQKELKRQGKEPALQYAIEESLRKSKNPKPLKKIMKIIASFDQKYNSRRFYRLVFSMNKNQDRNFLFKLLFEKGALK